MDFEIRDRILFYGVLALAVGLALASIMFALTELGRSQRSSLTAIERQIERQDQLIAELSKEIVKQQFRIQVLEEKIRDLQLK